MVSVGGDRSLGAAIENINGMSTILTLVPLLTGKVQNMKMIASRVASVSLFVAGLGGGKVLTKLQVGVFLWSLNLYHNLVAECSYHHDELVNNFAPALMHVPSGTPERHSGGVVINHNPSESYMVEAWFQSQGQPANVNLRRCNNVRLTIGLVIFTIVYAGESYISVRSTATGTTFPLVSLQALSWIAWTVGVVLLQLARGQGPPTLQLNQVGSEFYRCFNLPIAGDHVQSADFSFHIENLQNFLLFSNKYDSEILRTTGGLFIFSGLLDMAATVLIVGLNISAYYWLAYQLLILAIKTFVSTETFREITISSVIPATAVQQLQRTRIPLKVISAAEFTFVDICVGENRVRGPGNLFWVSRTPGVYIGQEYYEHTTNKKRYLALSQNLITLVDTKPGPQQNEALQREFLAALAVVVQANRVPSRAFVCAVRRALEDIQSTMSQYWFMFGSKDVVEALAKHDRDLAWRWWA